MTALTEYGPKPKLGWVPIADIYVDHVYQRTLESAASRALVAKIAANFCWARFGAALLTKTDKGFAALDGQHRIEGARVRGDIKSVPAVIVEAGTTAEQAMAFVGANMDRVPVNLFALHHARLAAKEPVAVEINKVCKAAGIEIPKYAALAKNLKPGQTVALAAIGIAVKVLGAERAIIALGAVATAYEGKRGFLRAALIKAVARMYQEGTSASAITAALKKSGDDIEMQARAWNHANGESMEAAYRAVIRELIAGKMPSVTGRRPDVAGDLDSEARGTKLPQAMRRRCDPCGGIFMATKVGQINCGCRKGARQ